MKNIIMSGIWIIISIMLVVLYLSNQIGNIKTNNMAQDIVIAEIAFENICQQIEIDLLRNQLKTLELNDIK